MKTNTRLLALTLMLALLLAATPAGAASWGPGLTANEPALFPTVGVENYVKSAIQNGAILNIEFDLAGSRPEVSQIVVNGVPYELEIETNKDITRNLKTVIDMLASFGILQALQNGETLVFKTDPAGTTPGESQLTLNGISLGSDQSGSTHVNYQTVLNAWGARNLLGMDIGLQPRNFHINGDNLYCNGVELEDGGKYRIGGKEFTFNNSLAAYNSAPKDKDSDSIIEIKNLCENTKYAIVTKDAKPLFSCSVRPNFKVNFAINPKLYVALSDMELHEEFFDAAILSKQPFKIDHEGQLYVTITLSNVDLSNIRTVNVGEWAMGSGESSTGGIVCVSGEVYNPATGECECATGNICP